jgi:hypothetical protein
MQQHHIRYATERDQSLKILFVSQRRSRDCVLVRGAVGVRERAREQVSERAQVLIFSKPDGE